MYDFYVQKWTEEATLERKQGEKQKDDPQAQAAQDLTGLLKRKEAVERLTSKQLLEQFRDLEAPADDPRYAELVTAFAEAKAREEEEREAKQKQDEENAQTIQDIEQSGDNAEGLVIPIGASQIINKVTEAEKIASDKASYELTKRLLLLQGRNVEAETLRRFEASLEEKEIEQKYKLVQKLNLNRGQKGTLIGSVLKSFFGLNPGKNAPTEATVENIKRYLGAVEKFIKSEKGKAFDYDGFKTWEPQLQQKIIKLYVMALLLNQISTLKGAKALELDAKKLKDAFFGFEFIFNETMRPVFDKITTLLFNTAAMQKIVKSIKSLNDSFDIQFAPIP